MMVIMKKVKRSFSEFENGRPWSGQAGAGSATKEVRKP
jgi:hypothetical protein